jgi:hypothetical protein
MKIFICIFLACALSGNTIIIFLLLINSCERVKILCLKHNKTIAFLFIENIFLLSLQSSTKYGFLQLNKKAIT